MRVYEEKKKSKNFAIPFSVVLSVVFGRRLSVIGYQLSNVDRWSLIGDSKAEGEAETEAEAEAKAEAETLPFPHRALPPLGGIAIPNVVAPPHQNPTSHRPRDPRSNPGRTNEGNPSSLSPERLRLPRCPGNLSLGLATTASVHRGSIHRVPSPRSFSSAGFSALFFPP